VVLTEDWCNDHQTENDGWLVKHLDPAARDRRLLPLLLEPCELPQHIGRLVRYDFTEPTLRKASLAKLLADLGRSRTVVHEILIQHAHNGIAALVQLMKTPAIRPTVLGIQETLTGVRDQIRTLARCKKMHEYLHGVHEQLPVLRLTKRDVDANAPAAGEEETP